MKKYFLLFVLLSAPVSAASPKENFGELSLCLSREAESCGGYFAEDSQALYEKLLKYDAFRCMPENISYVSELKKDDAVIVRARIKDDDMEQIARLAFTEEGDDWKLNLPETLRRGVGEHWNGYVAMIETAYQLAEKQLKTPPNCEMVKGLLTLPKND